MSRVLDSAGRSLRFGDAIRTGDLTGTYLGFEDDEPFVSAESGDLTGQIVVEIDGDVHRLPAFAGGDSNICYDVERI